jgi:hypothetical protein
MALLARELAIANDEAHCAIEKFNGQHCHRPGQVLYDARSAYFNPMDGTSVGQNWENACACLTKIRQYYRVLPPKPCLTFGFSDSRHASIQEYMRRWDEDIARKELAKAHALAARAYDQHNARSRKRAWKKRGLSLESQ